MRLCMRALAHDLRLVFTQISMQVLKLDRLV
jgi:hypothetical protein